MIQRWKHPEAEAPCVQLLCFFPPVQIKAILQLNERRKRMLLMNLTERCSVCKRSNCDGFWWRVFTPEYSRNIWCELVVIVGFRETTVCLVRGERGDSMEKRCSKGSKKFSNCPSVCHNFKALSFYCSCYTNKIIAASYFL